MVGKDAPPETGGFRLWKENGSLGPICSMVLVCEYGSGTILRMVTATLTGANRPNSVQRQLGDTRERIALELRLRGYSYPAIAREMEMSTEGARKCVMRAMEEVRTQSQETALEVREQEAARLDRILVTLERLLERAEAADDVDNALAVQDRLLKVQERRARLLGLDLARVEVTGAGGGPIAIAAIQRVIVDPSRPVLEELKRDEIVIVSDASEKQPVDSTG